ncbi:MAG TPA: peroxiredoxin [Verrucomicrobiota bacterium]|nr:peroxiredoxin [Verrucomicrobiota bacterium]
MKKTIAFPVFKLPAAMLFAAVTAVSIHAAEPLKVGDTAPLVTSTDQDGKEWKLADVVGKKIVLLYFYPKDFTGGCTKQACTLRDDMGELQTNNVQVVGVSFDSAESHKKFIAEHNLNFPLLADTDGKVADAYGARRDPTKAMAQRISFLIGLDGKIVAVSSGGVEAQIKAMKEAIAKVAAK